MAADTITATGAELSEVSFTGDLSLGGSGGGGGVRGGVGGACWVTKPGMGLVRGVG